MGNLKEVRSPKGELLYYVEVEENETKKRRSKAKARSKPKSNSEFPYVDMPPKTVKGKGGKLIYPKWLLMFKEELTQKLGAKAKSGLKRTIEVWLPSLRLGMLRWKKMEMFPRLLKSVLHDYRVDCELRFKTNPITSLD